MKVLALAFVVAAFAGVATSLWYNGKQYLGITTKRSWLEQQWECRRIGNGWAMASVPTVADFDGLKNYVIQQLNLHNNRIWIGGTDRVCEGTWFWEHNFAIIDQDSLKLREPDELGNYAYEDGGEENCMEMSRELNGINDRPCDKAYVALCQKY